MEHWPIPSIADMNKPRSSPVLSFTKVVAGLAIPSLKIPNMGQAWQ